MFIAIVGTRSSGKSTLKNYLVETKGFTTVQLCQSDGQADLPHGWTVHCSEDSNGAFKDGSDELFFDSRTSTALDHRLSFLSMTSPLSSSVHYAESEQVKPLYFASPFELLHHVTRNWRTNFVTVDLTTKDLIRPFSLRPFFMVINVDAPLWTRFKRSTLLSNRSLSLEDFVREHDQHYYGTGQPNKETVRTLENGKSETSPLLLGLNGLVNLHVVNSFDSIPAFCSYLDSLNLLDPERLRPGWDAYFMQLASLASHRSNCMKRRVGAILVRNKRILATGYNGTPRGLLNCNEGGCSRCNSASDTPDECVCLHAEENALLEAGRERVGDGAVLYCNTCPCLKCTIKIIQTGVREVVYNLGYKVDDASAALFKQAGVILRRHATPA